MTENWRKKMAISLVLTLPEPKVGMENSLPFSRTDPGVMRSRRSCCSSTSLLAATRSPLTFSPDALFPENVKTGMVTLSSLLRAIPFYGSCPAVKTHPAVPGWGTLECLAFRGSGRLGHPGGAGRTQSGAAIDHFLQFVLVAGAHQRSFNRDLLLEVRCRQRLVESLHTELFLPGLHGGINLVNLVFADQVANGGIGHHDFHAHGPALVVRLGQQTLAHDAFQHE